MALNEQVHIARRFQKSIRIDKDLGQADALKSFVCPQSSTNILHSMVNHVSETGQGAFTWTGPYGSGKSSLVVAFSALLNGSQTHYTEVVNVFGEEVTNAVRKSLPPGSKGWRVVPVIGQRGNPTTVIGEALKKSNLLSRRPRGGWTEDQLVVKLTEIAASHSKSHGGLILFVDEMGKFLEAAAKDGADIYIFQQLAEAASRSNGRFLLVGVLHQAFEEYAHRISREMRDEWTKVQGRFIDLPVNAVGEEQIELISRAIQSKREKKRPSRLSTKVARLVHRDRRGEANTLAMVLENCWPLHPVVACLLGPISRRRFGQNQRSVFGFLNSSEPHGFQEFLRSATKNDLYRPEQLWDYLRTNLEPSILASPDGHRWSLAVDALERCETISGDTFHINLLKTIAIIDLFKERSGLVSNYDLLRASFSKESEDSLTHGLSQLRKWSLTIYKKFQNAYAIFAGSDFDIDQEVGRALEEIDSIDFNALKSSAGFQPILAKRHYHETGVMRWFDVNIVPASEVVGLASRFKTKKGAVDEFQLVIPTLDESKDTVRKLCREAAGLSDKWDVVVGFSNYSWSVVVLARELLALEKVSNDRPELAGDPVARRGVSARLSEIQGKLELELHKSFDRAEWHRKHHSSKYYRQVDLNNLASELADKYFNKCPKLHNELLNRQKPSGSAIAAQNSLLKRMISKEGEVRLGIVGYPAEGGLFMSLLEITGLYSETEDGWHFISPSKKNDPCRLYPAWKAAKQHVKKNKQRLVSVKEIYDEVWAQPPYGVKAGLVPILSVAFILTQRESLAIYREGVFRARFDDVDVDLLAKNAETIELRWMNFDSVSVQLLSDMSEIVRELDKGNELKILEPIDVARGLVAIYEKLPKWTKRTIRLSSNAVKVRELFRYANDPNKFLFDDIPALKIYKKEASSNSLNTQEIVSVVKEGLQELVQAYPAMIRRLKDMMLDELQVPNLSQQSLVELRDRAINVKDLSGDFRLNAFVGRLAQFEGSDSNFEGIASLAANKPPRDWVDPDMDRAAMEITDMAQRFLRTETFTRIKGRPEKRHAMAVVVGVNGKPTPVLGEFDVTDSDRVAIDELKKRVSVTLESTDKDKRNVILATLAELSVSYMQEPIQSFEEKVG